MMDQVEGVYFIWNPKLERSFRSVSKLLYFPYNCFDIHPKKYIFVLFSDVVEAVRSTGAEMIVFGSGLW